MGRPLPILPSSENIEDIARLFEEAGALAVVESAEGLARVLGQWTLDESSRVAAGAAGKALFDVNQGATDRSFERVLAAARRDVDTSLF